jgi:hypothetical protein
MGMQRQPGTGPETQRRMDDRHARCSSSARLVTRADSARCPTTFSLRRFSASTFCSARQHPDLALSDSAPLGGRVLVRRESPLGYRWASWEINLGCNYGCSHCYLGLKEFSGLPWPDKERLPRLIRDAGVVWLQQPASRRSTRTSPTPTVSRSSWA